MKSHTTARFRKMFRLLPADVRQQARKTYKLFQKDPYHPGLHFKQIHPSRTIYSVRINLDYRALGIRKDDVIT